jgi:hypothetical protein
VIVDGDPSGIEVVRRLREKYKEWPNEAFRTWSTTDFEHYYPEPFQGEVQRVLGLPRGRERQHEKLALLEQVRGWADAERMGLVVCPVEGWPHTADECRLNVPGRRDLYPLDAEVRRKPRRLGMVVVRGQRRPVSPT